MLYIHAIFSYRFFIASFHCNFITILYVWSQIWKDTFHWHGTIIILKKRDFSCKFHHLATLQWVITLQNFYIYFSSWEIKFFLSAHSLDVRNIILIISFALFVSFMRRKSAQKYMYIKKNPPISNLHYHRIE